MSGSEAELQTVNACTWAAVFLFCTIAAIWDLKQRRIPNLLTGPAWLMGVAWATWIGGFSGLGEALAAGFIVALPFLVLFMLSSGGGGDVKMMAAVGAWLGLHHGLAALVCVLICGAVLGTLYAFMKGRLQQVFVTVVNMCLGLLMLAGVPRHWSQTIGAYPRTDKMLPMPYGLAIWLGVSIAAIGSLKWHV